MYCANCGVKLADTENQCPLCGTAAYHPQIPRQSGQDLYPKEQYPPEEVSSFSLLIVLTTACLLSSLITLLCDLNMSPEVTWSGYVIGGIVLLYCFAVLPCWFKKPNPVVFVPIDFALAGLFLLYINYATGGSWFLSFAFPVTGFVALLVTSVITLRRYVHRGKLYVYGGAFIAMGLFMPLMGFLLNLTFFSPSFALWSLYPLTALVLIGAMLIFLAICRPARETMHRKFFL